MTKGFTVPERTATLVLDEPPYQGAEIEVSLTVGLGTYLGIMRWSAMHSTVDQRDAEAVAVAMEQAVRLFGENALLGWNLERAGRPIPATPDGMLSLGVDLMSQIISTWLGAIAGGDPLASRSGKQGSMGGSSTVASSPNRQTRRTQRASLQSVG